MDKQIRKTLNSLKRKNFKVRYAENIKTAREKILELIPAGATVGIGDSVSLRQLKVLPRLTAQGRILVNPFTKEISTAWNNGEVSKKQWRNIAKMALNCEFFLSSTNALTEDGKLVNVDGVGNRVCGMIFGPSKAVIVAGRNKIVKDEKAAFTRIKNIIAPQHAKMIERKTPCASKGRCIDCESKERICNVRTILDKEPSYTHLTVMIINKDLGLGWDEDWSEDRIDRIYSSYAALTWMKRPAWLD